ncbi:MAG: hypothetical protein ABIQ72_03695 [Usitatibacter sp.]
MKRIALALLAAAPAAIFAASPPSVADTCSLKATPTKKKSELLAQATTSPSDAQAVALDAGKGTKVARGGIYDRDGCVVYVFHVRNEAEKTQTEVVVDGGNGKVLWQNTGAAPAGLIKKPVDNTRAVDALAKEKMAAEKAKAAGPMPAAPTTPPGK